VTNFLEWLIAASWQGSVLVLVVLLARWAMGERLSPGWRCAMWLIVLVRLILPVAPSAGFSIFNVDRGVRERAVGLVRPALPPTPKYAHESVTGQATAAIVAADTPGVRGEITNGTPRDVLAAAQAGASVRALLFAVWLAGAIGVLLAAAFTAGRVLELLRTAVPLERPDVDAMLRECADRIGVRARVRVFESATFAGPAVVGWWMPRLVLPEGMADRLAREELRAVILHELAHIKRRDIPLSWLAACVVAVHWFNPLAWAAVVMMRRDRELACDRIALDAMAADERTTYGETLLKLAAAATHASPLPGVAAIVEHRSGIHRRISMIAKYRRMTLVGSMAAAVVVGIFGLAGLTNASQPGKAAAQAELAEKADPWIGFYFMPYTPGAQGDVTLGAGVKWHVQSQYIGIDEKGERHVDDRTTVVLQDQKNSFWPLIMKLGDRAAADLTRDLQLAIENRKADLAKKAKQCAPEPDALQVTLSPERLSLDAHKAGTYHEGRWAINPSMPDLPHLAIEVTWYMKTPLSSQTNVGQVKMSVKDAEDLLSQLQAVQAQRKSGSLPVAVPQQSAGSDIRLYTNGLALNEWGAAELDGKVALRALPRYTGSDEKGKPIVDDRLTIVLDRPAASMWHMVAKLSQADAQRFSEELAAAIKARSGEHEKGVRAIVATKPYKLDEHGMAAIPEHASMRVYSQYNGVDDKGVRTTDHRVTVVIDDQKAGFWGMVVRMDPDEAETFAKSLREAMASRSKAK
jgi:beta-lactamase regulating signal transducer with metallopeptidase domain